MSETSATGFVWLHKRIITYYARRYGPDVVMVYLVLKLHENQNTRECFPSLRTICQLSKLSRPTVLKAIRTLEEVGLIEVERRCTKNGRRQVNHYTLLPVGEGQSPLPPLVNDVDHPGKPALPEQDLINKTQENRAVVAYEDTFKLTPNEAQAAAIAAVVTDIDRWQEVLNTWLLRNWSKAYVEGMLDRYKRSILEGSGGNGRNAGIRRDARSGRFGFQGSRAYDRRESRPPETPEERARRDAEWAMLVKQSQDRGQHDEA